MPGELLELPGPLGQPDEQLSRQSGRQVTSPGGFRNGEVRQGDPGVWTVWDAPDNIIPLLMQKALKALDSVFPSSIYITKGPPTTTTAESLEVHPEPLLSSSPSTDPGIYSLGSMELPSASAAVLYRTKRNMQNKEVENEGAKDMAPDIILQPFLQHLPHSVTLKAVVSIIPINHLNPQSTHS
ncbi:hypothetical protein M422DRAFT_253941 [Sphaerobolus stellatus SS14]|uniref:Uncharacterized protein n=1 Tax=Sphaerobolus stellatus (strain SS14) TaxID=990650 RepID=A0A0C9VM16_SPHS4|nr:hypothetical protein M422DRAFT_253941 [Sphaerobolus stellatus SS14]